MDTVFEISTKNYSDEKDDLYEGLEEIFLTEINNIIALHKKDLNLKKIDWVIVGGESGRTPRPMNVDWVLDIQQQCDKSNVAFFFKQWGGTNKKKTGRVLNGKTYDEMPVPEEVNF